MIAFVLHRGYIREKQKKKKKTCYVSDRREKNIKEKKGYS